jgi:hypothetical protein
MTDKLALIIFILLVFIRLFQIYYYIFLEPMILRKNKHKKDKKE